MLLVVPGGGAPGLVCARPSAGRAGGGRPCVPSPGDAENLASPRGCCQPSFFPSRRLTRADGALQRLVDERYASWSGPLGRRIESGSESMESLEREMLAKGDAAPCTSGRQELFENIVNTYL